MESVYPKPNILTRGTVLREAHRGMLLDGSGIYPEVAAERGYRTVTRADVPDAFRRYQRRSGLLIPMCSPDGTVHLHQLRPDKPRVRNGKEVKYETPKGARCILDVHPRNRPTIGDPDVPLWITEGIKKADSLTSRGLCTVGLIGVWNWQKDGELLPEWEHVALNDRRVYVVFDSDVMVKEEVQLALERLVGELEARGAAVKVVYLPENGSKVGVDDYLVAGGTVEALHDLARPFERSDYTRIRLSRSDRLRAAVEGLWAFHEAMPTTRDTECVRRAVFRSHLAAAAHRGKPGKKGRSVSYFLASEDGAIAAGTSQPTWSRHTRALEESGVLRISRPSDKAKANSYDISTPDAFGTNNGRKVHKESLKGDSNKDSVKEYDRRYSQKRPAQDQIPEARWSRIILSWRVDDFGRRVCDVDPLLRLGPKRREILVHLFGRGGSVDVSELMPRFASANARPFDFVHKVLGPMLRDFPIVALGDDGRVALREGWREALENARLAGQEQEAHEKQVVNTKIKRAAFGARDQAKADRAPTQAEMDAAREERECQEPVEVDSFAVQKPDKEVQQMDESDKIDFDFEQAEEEFEDFPEPTKPLLTPLAATLQKYLERNPRVRDEPPSCIAIDLWKFDLVDGKPTAHEVREAMVELGLTHLKAVA